MPIIEQHIVVTQDILNNKNSVVSLLAAQCHLSHVDIKQAISKGALWLSRAKRTKRLRRLTTQLQINDALHFYYNSEVLAQQPAEAVLVADHVAYSVWYKPYGMLSQGSKWSDHCTIARYAQQYFNNDRSCFIVHRLDRAATGLIIVSHSKKATQALSKMFEAHDLTKQYQIIVTGDFQPKDTPLVINTDIDGKKAKSTFNFNQYNEVLNASLINVLIETGRKHQIRKHAASIGFSVIGDRFHGIKNKENKDMREHNMPDLQLCAVKLKFICPLSDQIVDIELPEKYRPSLVKLAN